MNSSSLTQRYMVLCGILVSLSGGAVFAEDEAPGEGGFGRVARLLGCGAPFTAASGDATDEEADEDAPADEDVSDTTEESDPSAQGLTLLDCTNVRLVAKNITQEDEDGDSNFGIGLDWDYNLAKSWEHTFSPTLSVSGEGFVSLGDPNGSRSEADDAANFNSIVNQMRFTAQGVHTPELERAEPIPVDKGPAAVAEWKKDKRDLVRRNALRQATGYIAVDLGFHARTESNQSFHDTQVALGGGATVASGLISSWLLMPLSYLVPDRDEYGAVVQSPLVFIAIDEVLDADQRSAMDDSDDDNFERFRLELAWTSELLLAGLYPFVNFQFFQEIDADSDIKAADKDSTTFVEGGARYYVGSVLESVRRFAGGSGGPFVTLKYATGALPPYLESDHQASVGLGLDF